MKIPYYRVNDALIVSKSVPKSCVTERTKLKKLFIPLLIILKLFKLKLLLFLPFIFGLASFKKLLGFLAIVIPGLIGFFKLCKPDLQHNYGSYGHSMYYRPPQQHHVYPLHPTGAFPYVRGQDADEYRYPVRQDAYGYSAAESSPSVAFKDGPDAQQLAYQGYKEYQTK